MCDLNITSASGDNVIALRSMILRSQSGSYVLDKCHTCSISAVLVRALTRSYVLDFALNTRFLSVYIKPLAEPK